MDYKLISFSALGLLTLGNGFGSFVRSLLSSLVEPDVIGTVYTALSIMDSIGSIVAGPVVAGLFNISMGLEGIWLGLPFVSSFVLSSVIAVSVFTIRPKTFQEERAEEERGDDDETTALLPGEEE